SRSRAGVDPRESPRRVLAEQLVVAVRIALHDLAMLRPAGVAEGDERVPLQVTAVVAGDVEPFVPAPELLRVGLQPVDERDDRPRAIGRRRARPAFLDAAVPRAHVLTDVAAVDDVAEMLALIGWDRPGALRRPREAAVRIECPGLVERVRRTGLDAERAGAAVGVER